MIGGILVIIDECNYNPLHIYRYKCKKSASHVGYRSCSDADISRTFENIGMCIGIFPVTGITLPFFSYGGSSLVTTLLAIGLVINVKYRSRLINF